MKIKTMVIDNVFSFGERTTLHFTDHANGTIKSPIILAGPNNSGKSNVFRVFRIITNLVNEQGFFDLPLLSRHDSWQERTHLSRKSTEPSQIGLQVHFSKQERSFMERYLDYIQEEMLKETIREIENNINTNSKDSMPNVMLEELTEHIPSVWNEFFTRVKDELSNAWLLITYLRDGPQPDLKVEWDFVVKIDSSQFIIRWVFEFKIAQWLFAPQNPLAPEGLFIPQDRIAQWPFAPQNPLAPEGPFIPPDFLSFVQIIRLEMDNPDILKHFESYKSETPREKSSLRLNSFIRDLVEYHSTVLKQNDQQQDQQIKLKNFLEFWHQKEYHVTFPPKNLGVDFINTLKQEAENIGIKHLSIFIKASNGTLGFILLLLWILRQRLKFFDASILGFQDNFIHVGYPSISFDQPHDATKYLARTLFTMKNNKDISLRRQYKKITQLFERFYPQTTIDVSLTPSLETKQQDEADDEKEKKTSSEVTIHVELHLPCRQGVILREIYRQLPLSHAAAGMTQVLGLLTILLGASEDDIICLDEPTANLHPSLQAKFLAFLAREYPFERNQTFIVTHSPALIRIPTFTDNLYYFRLHEESMSTTVMGLQEVMKKKVNFGKDVVFRYNFAQMVLASKVLLVEGATDRDVLLHLDAIVPDAYRMNLESHDVAVLPMGSKDNAVKYLKIVKALSLDHAVVLDGDALITYPNPQKKRDKFEISSLLSNIASKNDGAA